MLGAFQPPEKLSNETHTQPRTPRRLTPSIRPESPSISRLVISIDCARAVLPYFAILRQFLLSASRESGPIGCPYHEFRTPGDSMRRRRSHVSVKTSDYDTFDRLQYEPAARQT